MLFDVDGTITESGQPLDENMKNILKKISEKYDIGIVGGGKMDKVLNQLGDLYFHHYFFECGCVYYKNDSLENICLVKQYYKNIRDHPLYKKINMLVKYALYFISCVDYIVTGNFIDLRNGMIYISLIGMDANNDERLYFMNLDKTNNYRQNLLLLLQDKAKKLNIFEHITICEGGTVGLAIYPNENDKIQVLDYLTQYDEIHYFGDKYNINGNDYNIINNNRVHGYPIDNVDMTKHILNIILTSNEHYE